MAVITAADGTLTADSTDLPMTDARTGVPTFSRPARFSMRNQTSTVVLPGSSAGLMSETLAGTGSVRPGTEILRRVSELEALRDHLRKVKLGEDGRGIHHGEQSGAGSCGLTSEERAVGDHTGDGASDLGVGDLGLCAEELPFG